MLTLDVGLGLDMIERKPINKPKFLPAVFLCLYQ